MYHTFRLAASAAVLVVVSALSSDAQVVEVPAPGVQPQGATTVVVKPLVPVGTESTQPNIFGLTVRQDGVGRVMAQSVDPAGAAAKAGVAAGDQILTIGDIPIDSVATFEKRMTTLHPDETIEFTIYHNNRSFRTTLTPRPAPAGTSDTRPTATSAPAAPTEQIEIMGMTLKEVVPGVVAVSSVSPNSAAAAAGVMAGDVVLGVATQKASPLDDLMNYTARLVPSLKPGSAIPLEISRGGSKRSLALISGNNTGRAAGNNAATWPSNPQAAIIVGIVIRDIGPGQVSVVDVAPESPAALAKLQPADLITAVDRQPVGDSRQFLQLVGGHRLGDIVELQVMRQKNMFLTKMPLVPRVVDLATVSTGEANVSLGQSVQALEQQIQALQQHVQVLQDQLNASQNGKGAGSNSPKISATSR